MDSHITIDFPPIKIGFNSPSPIIIKKLLNVFSGYECNDSADFTVKVLPSRQLPLPLTQIRQNWVPLMVNGNEFTIGPQVIEGTINFAEHYAIIAIHHNFFNLPTAEVLQEFLQRLYHTICRHMMIESYFMHACGVVREGTGYLFTGPHQSGKTTICQLSNGVVIHDDQILIRIDFGTLYMSSPPLPARYNLRKHIETPCAINRIFVINQADTFCVKRMKPLMAMASLYKAIMTPETLVSEDMAKAKRQKSAFCLQIIKAIPVYELYFDRDGKFWDDLLHTQWSRIDGE